MGWRGASLWDCGLNVQLHPVLQTRGAAESFTPKEKTPNSTQVRDDGGAVRGLAAGLVGYHQLKSTQHIST